MLLKFLLLVSMSAFGFEDKKDAPVYDRMETEYQVRSSIIANSCSVSGVDLKASEYKGKLPEGYCSVGITAMHCLDRVLQTKYSWLVEGGKIKFCSGKNLVGAEIPVVNSFGKETLNVIGLHLRRTKEDSVVADIALVLLPCGVEFSRQTVLAEKVEALAENFDVYTPVTLSDKEKKCVSQRLDSLNPDSAAADFKDLAATSGDSGSPVLAGKALAGVVTSVGRTVTKDEPKKETKFTRAHFGIKVEEKEKNFFYYPRKDFLSLLENLKCGAKTLEK